MGFVRNTYQRLLLLPGVPCCFRSVRRNFATIFMLHRFLDRDRGIKGLDPDILRRGLEYLRRNNYEFVSIAELISRLEQNVASLNGAVCFTIDDGYIDHADIASPIFAQYDCPVTTFVTTGFIDGRLWMWWNMIEYIILNTRKQSVSVDYGDAPRNYDLYDEALSSAAINDITESFKFLEEEAKSKAIARLAESAEIEIPLKPPIMYAPMSWDDARSCEKRGMTFGPHTVTHPILSRVDGERAAWEIAESWLRLKAEVRYPAPVFCYPNGQVADFGGREIELIRNAGLTGAVVGKPGFVDLASFKNPNEGPYRIKRISYPETLPNLIQYACGVERIKQQIRSNL